MSTIIDLFHASKAKIWGHKIEWVNNLTAWWSYPCNRLRWAGVCIQGNRCTCMYQSGSCRSCLCWHSHLCHLHTHSGLESEQYIKRKRVHKHECVCIQMQQLHQWCNTDTQTHATALQSLMYLPKPNTELCSANSRVVGGLVVCLEL